MRHRKIDAAILKHLPAEFQTLIDVGAGSGRLLSKIMQEHNSAALYALEPDNQYAKILHDQWPEMKIFNSAAHDIRLPDNSCDVVVSSLALHHMYNYEKALSEMIRILKHGGTLIIADMITVSRPLGKVLDVLMYHRGHKHFITETQLRGHIAPACDIKHFAHVPWRIPRIAVVVAHKR